MVLNPLLGRVPPSELGIRLFTDPPSGFDPLTAQPRELLAYGYPTRPDPDQYPELHALWVRRAGRRYTRIQPEFSRSDLAFGPIHGHRPATDPGVDYDTSTNWAGSVVNAPSSTMCTWVQGQWTVPDTAVPPGRDPAGSYYAGAWVGIDGWDKSTDVLQAGTVSYVYGGTKETLAWMEWFPAHAVNLVNFPVSAGDTIYCLICANADLTSATVYFTNDNTSTLTSFDITAPAGSSLTGNCAEWIVEAPLVATRPSTLGSFGTVYFDEAQAGLARFSGLLDAVNGTPITLVDNNGTPLATPTLEKTHMVKLTYDAPWTS